MLNRSSVRARQRGVNLIELMVGLTVGAIVVVGLLVLMNSISKLMLW